MPPESESPPSNLKHDLRTPLNHIIGFCEMLIEEAEDEDAADGRSELVPDLRKIHGAGRRLLGVINDLFDDSIPEAVRFDENHLQREVRTPIDQIIGYTELLQEDAEDLEDEACIEDLSKIRGAAHRLLELVLTNLGDKNFSTTSLNDSSAAPSVSLMHKDIKGTQPVGAVPSQRETSNEAGTILVADDDPQNREMLARRLRRLGHAVETADDGQEAIDKVRSDHYELLLLDIQMPKMNGYEVLAHLQANPPASALPIIVLSASDDSDQVARCIEMGAEDYLPKPFDPALLQARIDSSLEKKRFRDREAAYLETIKKEKERSDELLHVILPANIAAELKTTGEVKPRRVENVAVLFTDIVGFTSYCEKRTPETIHRDLQSLVKELESLTRAHGMEKIKTIGDAYLCAAGLLSKSPNPTLDCVQCGLDMIRAAEALPIGWQLRVGIHTGPVVAGVVGKQKYQYDIWGDTVNAAARMETSARPGTVCVNAETWKHVEAHCQGTSLGFHDIKGKGQHELFAICASEPT